MKQTNNLKMAKGTMAKNWQPGTNTQKVNFSTNKQQEETLHEGPQGKRVSFVSILRGIGKYRHKSLAVAKRKILPGVSFRHVGHNHRMACEDP